MKDYQTFVAEKNRKYEEAVRAINLGILLFIVLGYFLLKAMDSNNGYLLTKGNHITDDSERVDLSGLEEDDYLYGLNSETWVEKTEKQKKFNELKNLIKESGAPIEATEVINSEDLDLLVLAVQHEVGWRSILFPGYDFDKIQQFMAKSIWNRYKSNDFPKTLYGVLAQNGQYPNLLDDLQSKKNYNVNDHRTRLNCIKVMLNLEDYDIPDDIYFEISFPYTYPSEESEMLPIVVSNLEDNSGDTPVVSNTADALEWMKNHHISSEIYGSYAAVYSPTNGDQKRMIVFAGSPSGPY